MISLAPTDLVLCYIEGRTYPRATCHIHHKTPQYAGGSDAASNLIWLCANCHQTVHRASQMIKSGRKGLASDLSMTSFPSPAQRHRFMEVTNQEVLTSIAAKENGEGRKEITVEVPIAKDQYAKLKVLVQEYNLGKEKLSIADFCANLISAHIHKRMG